MDFNTIFIAVFYLSVIGVICAAILCIASRVMYVKVDERVTQLEAAMPGVNCGACGFPGCSGYAVALLEDSSIKANLCTPGGTATLNQISSILGVEAGSIEQKTAIISCNGDKKAQQKKMDYEGIKTCEAAKMLYGGQQVCAYGCMGYGDCQVVCPSKAICINNGFASVIKNNCTGCGLCIKVCPNKLISIENSDIPVFIACKNTEKGAVTRKKCTSGCIACTKCVKECCKQAITMINNLAVIDYSKCDGCRKCVEVCITKCILKP